MSIIPKSWSAKDDAQEVVDPSLLHEVYFNEGDGKLYRVHDFLLVQEPDTETQELSDATTVGQVQTTYTVLNPGQKRWYVVLRDDDGDDRIAFRYRDFRDNSPFHRVKNARPKVTHRSTETPRSLSNAGLDAIEEAQAKSQRVRRSQRDDDSWPGNRESADEAGYNRRG